MRLISPATTMAGVLAAFGGLATVWLLAAPEVRQADHRAAASQAATGETAVPGGPTKVRLRWDPSPDKDLAGYVVSWGDAPSKYTATRTVGPDVTSIELDIAPRPQPYFVAIQARNRAGQVGGYSNEFGLDLSSGTPRALTVPKVRRTASSRDAGRKSKLTDEEKAERRLAKQERKRKAREAATLKKPLP